MKLRLDGTIEGTPEEISEYMKINRPKTESREPDIKEKVIEAARQISKDFGSTLPKFSVGESFMNKEWLEAFSTKQLHDELMGREGVRAFRIAPHDEYSLIIGSVRHDRTGPATILINQD